MELDWTWDMELWKTADKYRLPGLMALARKDILGIGESLGTDEPLADDEMSGFAAMIRALYSCGPSNAVRRLRLKIVCEYREMASEIGQEPELRRLAEDCPGIRLGHASVHDRPAYAQKAHEAFRISSARQEVQGVV